MLRQFGGSLLAGLLVLLTAACGEDDPPPSAEDTPPTLTRVAIQDLPGWSDADPAPALRAFQTVCKRFGRRDAALPASKTWPALGTAGDWTKVCAAASSVPANSARAFVEANFHVYRVGAPDAEGLFTGYYEPEIPGARAQGGPYQTPLYRVPDDMIIADLGLFSEEWQGKRLTGRVENGRFKPYFARAEVAAGALAGRELEIVWLADPVDGFFLEIQGSGRIKLADGGAMRVGYAGKNGRAYRAIGRDLIEMGAVEREDMSMQAIRDWLGENPDQAQDVMNLNKSVVFFQERTGPGPIGAAGTALTPGYSLAVDPKFAPLGGLVYLDTPHPDTGAPPIRRLVAAEDVGGAIKGAIRGDLFWGTGKAAGDAAGRMISRGRYYLLAPKAGAEGGDQKS